MAITLVLKDDQRIIGPFSRPIQCQHNRCGQSLNFTGSNVLNNPVYLQRTLFARQPYSRNLLTEQFHFRGSL
jgi:hypothetical protein